MNSTLEIFRQQMRGKKPKQDTEKKSGFTMTPLLYLARQVAEKRNGNPFDERTVTKAIVDEQKIAVKRNANVTCIIIGGPGKGKSRLAFLLGKKYVALTGGKFKYCWDIDEIPHVPDGGWLHIDEWFIPEGQGRVIALQRMKNRFDTARAKQISISVSTPTVVDLPSMTFEASVLAQDWDNRQNMFEIRVYDPRFGKVHVGDAIFPVGKDDAQWKKFDDETKARKDRLWEEDGAKYIKKMDTKAAAQEVLDWVKKKGYCITTKIAATTFAEEVQIENKWRKRGWELNYYTRPLVVSWVMTLNEGSTVQKTYTGQVKDLRDALFARTIERGARKDHVRWMISYISGNIQTDVMKEFNITQDAVSKGIGIKSKLRSVLGLSFEDVWGTKVQKDLDKEGEGMTVKLGGGYGPSPDLLILDKEGDIVKVQSLKCQISKSTTTTVSKDKIAASEESLRLEGIPVELVYFDVVADKVHIVEVDGRAKYKFTRKV